MVDEYLGNSGECGTLECQNVEEILIEKVLATLRRLTDTRKSKSVNQNLMRHIYDVSQIMVSGVKYDYKMSEIFNKKIKTEIEMYGTHCVDFAKDPISILLNSLKSLNRDPKYKKDYEAQIFPMLFDDSNADFDFCIKNFNEIAIKLIKDC